MQAVILAAGQGSRLAPLTDNKPKALVEVSGVPIIWRVLATVIPLVNTVTIVGTERFFDDTQCLKFVLQKEPLGTADALRKVPPLDAPFLLLGCDTIFSVEHIKDIIKADSEIVLSTRTEQPKESVSTITYYSGGKIAGIAEKPQVPTSTTQSLMLYKLPAKTFDYLPRVKKTRRSEYGIQSVINTMIVDGSSVTTVECVDEYFHLTQMSDIEKFTG
jgi:glucose-1-phosphate thymidylyltransferase